MYFLTTKTLLFLFQKYQHMKRRQNVCYLIFSRQTNKEHLQPCKNLKRSCGMIQVAELEIILSTIILDSAWLTAVIKSLFPDSKEGSRQNGNRYIHTYIWSVNSFITYQLVCNKSNTMGATSRTGNT